MLAIKRALLSVFDKDGILDLAKVLTNYNVEILSTGGTARHLKEANIDVIEIEGLTKFPEILGGRVKTLHPAVFGAILARSSDKEHQAQLAQHGIEPIDLVCVNLYPFEEELTKGEGSLDDLLEQIDIGGQTLIRASAKNHEDVAVLVSPTRYPSIIEEMETSGGSLSSETLRSLALEAFALSSAYDATIYNGLLSRMSEDSVPPQLRLRYDMIQKMRYGENPHQSAKFYMDSTFRGASVPSSKQLHGKELSYNNILDLDAALDICKEFEGPCGVVIKHTNPSGVAIADRVEDALETAHKADPMSAFGGVVGLNRKCNSTCAEYLRTFFLEAVIAPEYEEDALALLQKKKNLRIMQTNGPMVREDPPPIKFTSITGGMLAQTSYFPPLEIEKLKVVTEKEPSRDQLETMHFGHKVLRHVKSNSVILVKPNRTVGIGTGQMSRVDSSMLACYKAKDEASGSVLVSDAFFPFRDGVDEVAKHGVAAILQPGGSIRDQEVIDAANEHGIPMVFSGIRLFKH